MGSEIVGPEVGSQAVALGEKDPTELKKKDLLRGHRVVDIRATERKVLIPGEKTREKAEYQYGVREVPNNG